MRADDKVTFQCPMSRSDPVYHTGTRPHSKTDDQEGQSSEGVCVRLWSFAKASTTEEPDEGKLHVRDCAGGAG
jgi:hypothetical protein